MACDASRSPAEPDDRRDGDANDGDDDDDPH